ncbi:hypothetical protein [Acidipila sp. EB88]|uniref:hypothetical protein n=1 Tax=Acidipila sp. EB88 TaxID=2305226 RepID=UPI000F5D5EF1|nr:hypothetical protein [Acidipila sp. EB88]RRA47603.1 hypothetical protein D1Y84_04150 [Acidipila sp. EB88]
MKQTPSRTPVSAGEDAFSRIIGTPEAVAALRKLLGEITGGPAFKGSQRSAQFLEFVIEQSIAGNFDQLKERLIGIRLFKREPSYDTGDDAIVRVTASDVRKRLLQHYGWFGTESSFRIELPLGSYIPRVSRSDASSHGPSWVEPTQRMEAHANLATTPEESTRVISTEVVQPQTPAITAPSHTPSPWLLVAFAAALLGAVFCGWFVGARNSADRTAAPRVLPWPALFDSSRSAHLITSDANIDTVEGITHTNLSLSDYANHKYIAQPNALTPEQLKFCRVLLLADSSAATPDLPITAKVAQIAQTFSKKLAVQTARSFQLAFLSNNDNFIFLGSPRSNPWFSAVASALDFQFVFNPKMGSEFIRNARPQKSEQVEYIPSANGGGTGYSYAIIAFVQNPDQNGEVLLLAGADGEATGAAGEFVADLPRMAATLQACGLKGAGTSRHFEILLQTDTMAGVSRRTNVIACHLLPGGAAASTSNLATHAAAAESTGW